MGLDAPLLQGAFIGSGSSSAGQLIWPELWQAVMEKMSMTANRIASNFFISITVHIHHRANKEWQIGLAVDQHIYEGSIQDNFLKFHDLHGPFGNHFHGGGSSLGPSQ